MPTGSLWLNLGDSYSTGKQGGPAKSLLLGPERLTLTRMQDGWIIRNIVFGLSYAAQAFDRYVIDGVVNGSVVVVRASGNIFRRTETGRVQNYAAAIFGGALLIVIVVFIVVESGK